jgi:hypothetical protein
MARAVFRGRFPDARLRRSWHGEKQQVLRKLSEGVFRGSGANKVQINAGLRPRGKDRDAAQLDGAALTLRRAVARRRRGPSQASHTTIVSGQGPVEIVRGTDQGEMGECLGEISKMFAGGAKLLGK